MKRVPLLAIAAFAKGKQINGDELNDSYRYSFLNGGTKPSGYWKESNTPPNTITISEGGNSCGFVNLMSDAFWCGAHCYALSDLKCDVRFLYYALKSVESELMACRTGVCMPNLKKSILGEFAVPFTEDHAAQQRIAGELDRLCALKKNAEDRLALLDQLVKSRFVEMFGDGRDSCVPLGAYAVVSGGFAFKSTELKHGGVPVIRISNLSDGGVVPDNDVCCSTEFWAENARYRALDGDVLMAMSGATTGKCGVVRSTAPMLVNQRVAIVRALNNQSNTAFLWSALTSGSAQQAIKMLSAGCAQPNISGAQIESILLPRASYKKQREFAAFVASVDKSKVALRETVATLDQLYRAKLQEYFS